MPRSGSSGPDRLIIGAPVDLSDDVPAGQVGQVEALADQIGCRLTEKLPVIPHVLVDPTSRNGGTRLPRLARARLHRFVDEVAPVPGTRVPLGELMDGRRPAAAVGAHVGVPPAGHEQLAQVSADLPEVTGDDEDREPAQADQGQ